MKKFDYFSIISALIGLIDKIVITILLVLACINVMADHNSEYPYFTDRQPDIDGIIDSIFFKGLRFDSFKQIEPSILSNAVGRTEIYFIYDRENVYLAGKIYQQSNTIKASSGRRDAQIILDGDLVMLAIDPLNNGNAANFFAINPANGIADGVMTGSNFDFNWDGIFNSATRIYEDHWTFEFKLPLTSINFQSKDEQTWGVMFLRIYAKLQEKSINRINDSDNPTRVDDFYKVHGLKNLRQKGTLQAIPYVFSSFTQDILSNNNQYGFKAGGELKYKPVPSMSILATYNPDFAQIETDAVIINVSDVPASYPERRPFFTESSDLYPGLAVNTRNIKDIEMGIKVRQVVKDLKYDATWIKDKDHTYWYLTDARWTNNKSFHAEIISGVKKSPLRTDYNITSNFRGWAFNRRLTFYNWMGTINRAETGNEFETVNSIQWVSRTLLTGIWSHVKSDFYNPNIVGHNTLSNEVIFASWVNYTKFWKDGFMRRLTTDFKAERKSLYSEGETEYFVLHPRLNAVIRPSETVGNWEFNLLFRPSVKNYFRYRNVQHNPENNTYEDSYSRFRLIQQSRSGLAFTFTSDYSKNIGVTMHYNNFEVRQSLSSNIKFESYWKITSKANIIYTFERIELNGSAYQDTYAQTFHRLKLEYNITPKFNIRSIVQLNRVTLPAENGFEERMPLLNLTASWQYGHGSFVYLVVNKYADNKKMNDQSEIYKLVDNQWIGIKLNKTFNVRK